MSALFSRLMAKCLLVLLLVACINACQRNAPEEGYNSFPPKAAPPSTPFNPDAYPKSILHVSGSDAKRATDLALLCKVWGFVKYYHPNVIRGGVDWDGPLLDMIPRVATWQSDSARDRALEQMITSLGAFPTGDASYTIHDSSVAVKADLMWIDSSRITPSLRALLRKVQHAYRKPCPPTLLGHTLMRRYELEIATPRICLRSASYRLLGLFRFWNVVQYLFPYKSLMDRPWDHALTTFIPRVAEADTICQYEYAIIELSTWLCDSHALVSEYQSNVDRMYAKSLLCMSIRFIGQQAYVVEGCGESSADGSVKRGDEVLAIDGQSITSLVDSIKRYVPSSNPAALYRDLAQYLVQTNAPQAQVRVRRGSREETVIVAARVLEFQPSTKIRRFFRRVGTGNYGLLDMDFYSLDSLKSCRADMKACDGLIIDVRSGNHNFRPDELAEFFLPWPTTFAKFADRDCSMPGRFVFKAEPTYGNRFDAHYKGKVVIMVDENTQSSLEFESMFFAAAPRAVIIGGQTAGADGNVFNVPLPGNGFLRLTGLAVYYPDGGATQRRGLRLTKKVDQTVDALLAGEDAVFNEAMRIVREP